MGIEVALQIFLYPKKISNIISKFGRLKDQKGRFISPSAKVGLFDTKRLSLSPIPETLKHEKIIIGKIHERNGEL